MREVRASAPGKVNLTLHAGAPGPDGRHPLVTVFEALDVRETVTVRTTRSPGIHVTTTAHRADGSPDPETSAMVDALSSRDHLAARAARLLQGLAAQGPWGATAAGVGIHVDKRVPVAGGMAGGSADAAATLVACNALWELGLDDTQLLTLGARLGADVPACLLGGISLGRGYGDRLDALLPGTDEGAQGPAAWPHHWVMALSWEGLATPDVFHALDRRGGPGGAWAALHDPTPAQLAALTGPARALAGALVNDLEAPALELRPELAHTLASGRAAGALDVVLSGSGPTVAALCADVDHARQVAHAWKGAPTVADVLITRGPALGAHIESEETH